MAIGYGVAVPKPEPIVLAKRQKRLDADKAERECRKKVKARDRGRCRIPNCNQRDVEMHHIVPRSRSSKMKFLTSNNCLLCQFHHGLRHAGKIQITGNADEELIITGERHYLAFRL